MEIEKKSAIIGIYTAIFVFTGVGAYLVSQNMKTNLKQNEQVEHVNSSVLDENEDIEVINETPKMIKPFKDESVATTKYFIITKQTMQHKKNQYCIMKIRTFKIQEWTLLKMKHLT